MDDRAKLNALVAKAIKLIHRDDLEGDGQQGADIDDVACFAAWQAMGSAQREVLKQLLFLGPVADGDIASKAARGDLFTWGLAVRCCFKGEQGYTAASYLAFTIWKANQETPRPRPTVHELEELLRPEMPGGRIGEPEDFVDAFPGGPLIVAAPNGSGVIISASGEGYPAGKVPPLTVFTPDKIKG